MFGLILAGGSGSRLWPLSRELYPKQLLNIQNTESLLQATFERLEDCMPAPNIISMTGVKHFSNVKYQLASMYDKAIVLSEPISKNTAPAIALASKYIMEKFNVDPSVASGALISTLSDVTSLLIYFLFAQMFLQFFIGQ